MRRFLQPDTIDLRRYAYAAGDPVNLVDPSGQYDGEPGTTLKCERDCGGGPDDQLAQPLPTLEEAEAGASWSTTITVTTVDSQSTVTVSPMLTDSGSMNLSLGPGPISFGLFDGLSSSMTHIAPRGGDSRGGGGSSAGLRITANSTLFTGAIFTSAWTLANQSGVLELATGGGEVLNIKGALREAARLAAERGGIPSAWVKVASKSFWNGGSGPYDVFEVHAYRNLRTGQLAELKTKFPRMPNVVDAAGGLEKYLKATGALVTRILPGSTSLGSVFVNPGLLGRPRVDLSSCANPVDCGG
jgi:hypothetical protein